MGGSREGLTGASAPVDLPLYLRDTKSNMLAHKPNLIDPFIIIFIFYLQFYNNE